MQRRLTLRAGTHGLWWGNGRSIIFRARWCLSNMEQGEATMSCYQSQRLCCCCVLLLILSYASLRRFSPWCCCCRWVSRRSVHLLTQSRTLNPNHSLTRTHSFIRSLSLSLPHTPSVAHVLSLCLLLCHSYTHSLSHTHKHTHSRLITHNGTRSLSLALSLSLTHTLSFTHAPTHLPTIHSPIHSISHSLTSSLSLSLSLTLVCMRERACVSLSPSFSRFLFCILSQAFSLSISFSFTHTLAHTQSHALSHALTHTRTQGPDLYPHLSRTLTHISLSFFLSLSLSYIQTWTRTHICTLTLSHLFTRPHTHSLLSRLRAALSSARVRRSLLSVSPPLPPFLILFLSESISFFSLPVLSLACLLAVFLSLVRFLSFSTPGSHDLIWNSPTLTASAVFHSLARGDFSQMEQWRGQIEGETNWGERIGDM